MKTVNIKGKEYVEVNERLKYFRKNYKDYSLETEIVSLSTGIVTMRAIIKNESGRIIATGFAQEKESSSYINKTSFIENCETSAWGRALGNLGIGIDTSIASKEEVENAITNQDNDLDIIEGLKTMDTSENAHAYYEEYKDSVQNLEKFKQEYGKVWQALRRKEKANAAT